MRIIITENQQSSLQLKLKKMIKDIGVKKTSNVVGGFENLAKLGFNSNPMEFLNMFNDLYVVQSKGRPNWVLFRYKKGNNMMVYDRENNEVHINYRDIWEFLEDGFGLNYSETKKLTQEWLGETYNLNGVTTQWISPQGLGWLGDKYNLNGVTTRSSRFISSLD